MHPCPLRSALTSHPNNSDRFSAVGANSVAQAHPAAGACRDDAPDTRSITWRIEWPASSLAPRDRCRSAAFIYCMVQKPPTPSRRHAQRALGPVGVAVNIFLALVHVAGCILHQSNRTPGPRARAGYRSGGHPGAARTTSCEGHASAAGFSRTRMHDAWPIGTREGGCHWVSSTARGVVVRAAACRRGTSTSCFSCSHTIVTARPSDRAHPQRAPTAGVLAPYATPTTKFASNALHGFPPGGMRTLYTPESICARQLCVVLS